MNTRRLAVLSMGGFALIAVAGVLLRPALPIDETRYLSVAWDMAQSGQYVVPHKNGAIYSDKPPLLFWLIQLVWAAVGPSGVAARLVAPAFGIAMLWLTGVLGRRLWPGEDTGRAAMAVLAGALGFQVYAGLTMFDTLLGTATLLGLLAILRAAAGDRAGPWVLVGASLAFGILAKGPVILFHLGPALATAPLWVPGCSGWRSLVRGAAVALGSALALVALWVVPATVLGGPEYRHLILWKQSTGRMVSSFAHARPWWFLVAGLPLMLFPWLWMPGMWQGLARLRWSDRGIRLCVIWAGAGLMLFSAISGKQLHYILPEMPAAALLVARGAGLADLRGWRGARAAAFVVIAGAAALALAPLGLLGTGAQAALSPFAGPLGASIALALAAAAALTLSAIPAGLTLGMSVMLCASVVIGTTRIGRENDAGRIARLLAPHQRQGLAVAGGRYEAQFNFAGRLPRPLDDVSPGDASGWLAAHPGGALAARCKDVSLGPPAHQLRFYGEDWCVWTPQS